ncbi:hypothetical protein [Pseudorhodoferax aquiterrae]|uniref:hypothetical protein n=1 Tax=Pseudorhodoferax aquiterrae TaxID=747304 RepID=UPI001E35FE2B|nr:hypothetical protein [Pseudorhodoferax aquiterrae]
MQFKSVPAFLIFLGSYFPLALILALQDVSEKTWESNLCKKLTECVLPEFNHPALSSFGLLLTGFCLVLTLYVISKIRYKYPLKVVESKPIPGELISYSFPYIVSFMGVDYSSPGKIAGLAAFLIWLFLITYKARQIIMNPILLIFGWSLYEAKISTGKHERSVKILSKTLIPPGVYICQEIQGSYITLGETDNA